MRYDQDALRAAARFDGEAAARLDGEAVSDVQRDQNDEGRRHRVFFALWPDDPVRGAIVRASRRVVRLSGGRPTAKRNLHITVAFLGIVDAHGLERALAVPPIETGSFELVLDRIGHWKEPRVLWLGPGDIPAALTALEQALWDGLERAGFERELRVYRPHLTLARRARAVDEAVPTVTWRATSLTLVESIPLPRGVHYEPLRDWPLEPNRHETGI